MFKNIAIGVAFGFGLFVFTDYALSIPSMKVSFTTGECVEVENYKSAFFGSTRYSCDQEPTKYNMIWVK